MCQLPRGKSFCASYLEDVDVESIKKLHASVPTVHATTATRDLELFERRLG